MPANGHHGQRLLKPDSPNRIFYNSNKQKKMTRKGGGQSGTKPPLRSAKKVAAQARSEAAYNGGVFN